ncbi:MAG TPA: VOC family protein [Caulobacteraceae bacterium]|nr:VOC family protein [Caulobacteraceae bacterium]
MKPKISIITLGVADVARSMRFYRDGLGFPTHNYTDGDDFAMFALEGSWLALYPREALAEDAQVGSAGSGFPGFSLAHNEPSPEAVDAAFAEALAVGATAVKRPEKVFWGGYSGYFADPDGHLWEVAPIPSPI